MSHLHASYSVQGVVKLGLAVEFWYTLWADLLATQD